MNTFFGETEGDLYQEIFSGTFHSLWEVISFLSIVTIGNDFLLAFSRTLKNKKVKEIVRNVRKYKLEYISAVLVVPSVAVQPVEHKTPKQKFASSNCDMIFICIFPV